MATAVAAVDVVIVDRVAKAVAVSAVSVPKANVPRANALKPVPKVHAKAVAAEVDAVAVAANAVSVVNAEMANNANASMPKANRLLLTQRGWKHPTATMKMATANHAPSAHRAQSVVNAASVATARPAPSV